MIFYRADFYEVDPPFKQEIHNSKATNVIAIENS